MSNELDPKPLTPLEQAEASIQTDISGLKANQRALGFYFGIVGAAVLGVAVYSAIKGDAESAGGFTTAGVLSLGHAAEIRKDNLAAENRESALRGVLAQHRLAQAALQAPEDRAA